MKKLDFTSLVANSALFHDTQETFSHEKDLNHAAAMKRLEEEFNVSPQFAAKVQTHLDAHEDEYFTFGMTLDLEPRGNGRPRASGGKFVTIYSDPKDTLHKKEIQRQVKELFGDIAIKSQVKELSVQIHFFMRPPVKFSRRDYYLAEIGYLRPLTTPDLDNCEKIVLDALNPEKEPKKKKKNPHPLFEGMYEDDKLITSLSSEKFYSVNPRIEVEFVIRVSDLFKTNIR